MSINEFSKLLLESDNSLISSVAALSQREHASEILEGGLKAAGWTVWTQDFE